VSTPGSYGADRVAAEDGRADLQRRVATRAPFLAVHDRARLLLVPAAGATLVPGAELYWHEITRSDVVAEAPRMEEALVCADVDLRRGEERREELPLVREPRFAVLRAELERLAALPAR
jgi:hypothetical protein